jgi:CRP/FNR family cyclic AMP-dependent transcriptional regulator
VLHRDDFARLRREQPQIDQFLLDAAVHEVRRLSAALVDALHVPAERRVLRRLSEVAALWPAGEPLPLSQQDIAQLAGVTRQSANRVLASAQADGLVSLGRGRVEVVDPEGLERAAR